MMSSITIVKNNILAIKGTLSFASAPALYLSGCGFIADHEKVIIDLDNADILDNSILALLTAWTRYAKKCHKKIGFCNLSQKLCAMAKGCGLLELLPVI